MRESLQRAGRKKERKGVIRKETGTEIGREEGIWTRTRREIEIGTGLGTGIGTGPGTGIEMKDATVIVTVTETATGKGARDGEGAGIGMMMTIIEVVTMRGPKIMKGTERTDTVIGLNLAPAVDQNTDQDRGQKAKGSVVSTWHLRHLQ
jgi:hypothetical protein